VSGHADSLPDDIEALRALALNAIAERDAVIAERDNAIALNDRLRHLLRQANDARFGSKSEKLSRLPPDQLALALEDIEQAIAKSEAIAEKARAHLPRGLRKANRGSLPKHLPHIHETIAPEDRTCPCCRAPMHVIGEETAERLDVIPAQYRVIVTHRPKLACRACEKMVQANAAEHLIKSGLPTEAMVASVFGGADPPAVVYTYAPGRGGVHLHTLLATYRGIVQCDGYAPYKNLPKERITLAFCWAHLRRQFFDIARKGDAPIATQALLRIAALYRIEATIRGKSPDERRTFRQAQSAPHCLAFKTFLDKQLKRVSAKSPIANAIRYGLNHWDGLVRFLDDGRIDLDTNIVERSMRPQALTRKNALFAGHDDGAENWAMLASLIETCKLNGIDSQPYIADVLTRLVNLWPNNRLDELLPWAWAAAREQVQRAA
jgi:hypothetical protein